LLGEISNIMPENYLSSRGSDTVLEDIYTMGSRLTADSAGGSGEVVRAVRKEDGACFAVKVMRTASTREDRSQIEFLKRVNHPGIIKLVDW
jgi:serine/threonine protein kinase